MFLFKIYELLIGTLFCVLVTTAVLIGCKGRGPRKNSRENVTSKRAPLSMMGSPTEDDSLKKKKKKKKKKKRVERDTSQSEDEEEEARQSKKSKRKSVKKKKHKKKSTDEATKDDPTSTKSRVSKRNSKKKKKKKPAPVAQQKTELQSGFTGTGPAEYENLDIDDGNGQKSTDSNSNNAKKKFTKPVDAGMMAGKKDPAYETLAQVNAGFDAKQKPNFKAAPSPKSGSHNQDKKSGSGGKKMEDSPKEGGADKGQYENLDIDEPSSIVQAPPPPQPVVRKAEPTPASHEMPASPPPYVREAKSPSPASMRLPAIPIAPLTPVIPPPAILAPAPRSPVAAAFDDMQTQVANSQAAAPTPPQEPLQIRVKATKSNVPLNARITVNPPSPPRQPSPPSRQRALSLPAMPVQDQFNTY